MSPAARSSVRLKSFSAKLQLEGDTAHSAKDSCGIISCLAEGYNVGTHPQTAKYNEIFEGDESYKEAVIADTSADLACSISNIRRSSRLRDKKRRNFCLHSMFKCVGNCSSCGAESKRRKIDKNFGFRKKVGLTRLDQIQQRTGSNVTSPAGNTFALSVKSSTSVPSCEFHVRSDEGINLFIDLNSTLSDWFKRLKNEVCDCLSSQESKFQTFRQELEFLQNSTAQTMLLLQCADSEIGMDQVNVQIDSSLYQIEREACNMGLNQENGCDGSSGYSASKLCDVTKEMSAHSEVKNVSLKCGLDFDAPNHILSDTESWPRDEGTDMIDANALDVCHFKLGADSVLDMTRDGSGTLEALEEPDSKVSDNDQGNTTKLNAQSLQNSYSPCSGIVTMELQLLEAASHVRDISCSTSDYASVTNFIDKAWNTERRVGKLADLSEINYDTIGTYTPAYAEGLAEGNPFEGKDALKKLQFSSKLDKKPDGEPKRKRHAGELDDGCGRHEGRILRSAKRPRRSMRLVSRVA